LLIAMGAGRGDGRRRAGLGELLSGDALLDDVIYPHEGGFDVLPAGKKGARRLGLGLVVATLSEAFDLIVLTGLDLHASDLEMIRPSLTQVILLDRPNQDEDNWMIEAALGDEPECEIHSVRAALPSILQKAA